MRGVAESLYNLPGHKKMCLICLTCGSGPFYCLVSGTSEMRPEFTLHLLFGDLEQTVLLLKKLASEPEIYDNESHTRFTRRENGLTTRQSKTFYWEFLTRVS